MGTEHCVTMTKEQLLAEIERVEEETFSFLTSEAFNTDQPVEVPWGGKMNAMHQPDRTEKYIQRMGQIVIRRFDGAVTGIFATEQPQNLFVHALNEDKIVAGTHAPDNIGRLRPHVLRIFVVEQMADLIWCLVFFKPGKSMHRATFRKSLLQNRAY